MLGRQGDFWFYRITTMENRHREKVIVPAGLMSETTLEYEWHSAYAG